MGPRMVGGGNIQSLMDLLGGGRDVEHEKIIDQISKLSNERLNEIAGTNDYARRYVHSIWHKCMKALQKKEVQHLDITPKILRIMADIYEERHRLIDALQERRKAEHESKTPIDKDLN